jgi:hypothetical protein
MNKFVRLLNRWSGVDVERLEQRLHDSIQKEKLLNENLQELRSVNEQLTMQLQDEKTRRQTSLQQLDEKENLIEDWQSKYEAEIRSQETVLAECEDLKNKLESAQRNVAQLESEVTDLQKVLSETRADREDIAAEKVQIEKDLNEKLQTLQQKMESRIQQAAQNENNMKAALDEAHKTAAEKELQIKELKEEQARVLAEMDQKEEQARVQLDHFRKNAEEDRAAQDKRLKELESEIAALNQEKIELRTAVQDTEKKYAGEKEQVIRENELACQKLRLQLNDIQTQLNDAARNYEQKIGQMTDESEALKKRLADAEQKTLQLNAEKRQNEDENRAHVDTLEKALAQLKEQMESQSREAEKKVETILAEKASSEMARAEKEKNSMMTLQTEKAELENEVAQWKNTCEQIKQELNRKDQDYQGLEERTRRDLARVQDKLVAMEQESRMMARKNESAESDNAALRDKLVSLETERVNLRQENKEQLQKLQTAEEEIARLNALIREMGEGIREKAPKVSPSVPVEAGETDKSCWPDILKNLSEEERNKPCLRLTVKPYMSQCLFDTSTLSVENGRLLGTDYVLGISYAVGCEDIVKAEGLDSPYLEDKQKFSPDNRDDLERLQAKLAEAVMNYRPLSIDYLDRNGIVRPFNLYWECFLPLNDSAPELPNETLFQSMLNDEVNPEYIIAKCAKDLNPEVFELNRILSVRQFDSFCTSEKGINALADGLYYAVINGQVALAELIYGNLPQLFRNDPYIVSNYAHCCVLKGNLKEALSLYLSIDPDSKVDGNRTWKEVLASDFEDLVDRGLEVENFMNVIRALVAEGWVFE